MAQFKSGHENIVRAKSNASFDRGAVASVTANGRAGLITMTVAAEMAQNTGSTSFTLSNTNIKANSVVNVSVCKNGGDEWLGMIICVVNVTAGAATIGLINHTAGAIAADKVMYISYQVVN